MYDREEIAHRYGFETFADLLDISRPLPARPGDKTRSYFGRRRDGMWFVWEDTPQGSLARSDNRQRLSE
jgi:hypothetical protein